MRFVEHLGFQAAVVFLQCFKLLERVGGLFVALRGGFAIPIFGFCHVSGYACACGVARGEVVLRFGVSFFGGFFVPLGGFFVVLRGADAVAVHQARHKLGFGFALRGGFFIPMQGLFGVGCGAQAVLIQHG